MRFALRRFSIVSPKDKIDPTRWSRDESFPNAWRYRSAFAAAMCADSRSVCDIGCGMQGLRSYLPKGIEYLPVDLVKRTEDTEICDLNQKQLPATYLTRADTVTLLGVIEYLEDVPWLFRSLSQAVQKLIVSYSPTDFANSDRRSYGWINDYCVGEVVEMLHAADFVVRDVRLCDSRQVLYLATSRKLARA
jgi:hypothetical protein